MGRNSKNLYSTKHEQFFELADVLNSVNSVNT